MPTSNIPAQQNIFDSKSNSNRNEINKGIRAILGHPVLYTYFGRIIGLADKYRLYMSKFIKPYANIKILDIGCGTAAILDFLPLNICYTGYDINTAYINYARKKYGHRAKFYNKGVNEMTSRDNEYFDVILADGLIHHLNTSAAKNLFRIGYRSLKSNGFMLTIDPVLTERQRLLERFIISMDRGRHIKSGEEYKKTAKPYFSNISVHIVPNIGILSLTACILKCCKE